MVIFTNALRMQKDSPEFRCFFSDTGKLHDVSKRCDLPSLILGLKNEEVWKKGELCAKTLSIIPGKRIVLAALHSGTEIKSRQLNKAIIIQVLRGKIHFLTSKKSVVLDKDQSLAIYEKVKYKLIAKEESVMLLTVATTNTEPEENNLTFCLCNSAVIKRKNKSHNVLRKREEEKSLSE